MAINNSRIAEIYFLNFTVSRVRVLGENYRSLRLFLIELQKKLTTFIKSNDYFRKMQQKIFYPAYKNPILRSVEFLVAASSFITAKPFARLIPAVP